MQPDSRHARNSQIIPPLLRRFLQVFRGMEGYCPPIIPHIQSNVVHFAHVPSPVFVPGTWKDSINWFTDETFWKYEPAPSSGSQRAQERNLCGNCAMVSGLAAR